MASQESSGGNPYGVDAVVSELRHRGTVLSVREA